LSKAECSILVAELSSPSTVKQRKLYCALSLAYAADQCASKCIDVTELSFAVQLWWAAISEILDASPSRAIAYFYKIALASIETAQDNVAAQALLNALLLEKSLKLSKPESLIAAERSILKFHPFSKVQSDMANFYRSWRTQVLENLDGKAISDEEFDSIINDIRSKYKFENEAALVPESKAASLDI